MFLIHSFGRRLLLASLVVLVDVLIFLVPIGSLFLAYVILARPAWLKGWVDRLYD